MNRYAYANGNPISNIDPFGLSADGDGIIHGILDFFGMMPVVGVIFDGANTLLYLAEGDYVNAALSGVSMLPWGDIVGKGAKWGKELLGIGAKYADDAIDIGRNVSRYADDVIDAGDGLFRYSDDAYDIMRKNGIPSTLDDIDRKVLDSGNWRMKYEGAGNSTTRTPINPNPFKGKTPAEIDEMFKTKGYKISGNNPIEGYGGYVNLKTGRSYHIDPHNSFNEPPHVDVNRLRSYKGKLEKKKLFLEE